MHGQMAKTMQKTVPFGDNFVKFAKNGTILDAGGQGAEAVK